MMRVCPDPEGWIGSWSPGIGDPSVLGWLTVIAYGLASWACWRVARGRAVSLSEGEARLWWVLVMGLCWLGINKQLDLQTAFTEVGRIIAHQQGWYERRWSVQLTFMGLLSLLSVATGTALLILTRRTPLATRCAVVGAVVLITFVAIRAASFHHVDRFIGRPIAGVTTNWVLELGGISLIFGAARARLAVPARGSLTRP